MADLRLVIVTGLSGAGKTQAVHSLEDLGYYCVDNLPPSLLPKFAELLVRSTDGKVRAAVVIDVRVRTFFEELGPALADLKRLNFPYEVLFLEARPEVLIRRYKETRRQHPLAGDVPIQEAIAEERRRLGRVRGQSRVLIDTSDLTAAELRQEIRQMFSEVGAANVLVHITSFGFKHGIPLEADLVLDVRFIPNPFYQADLRTLSGKSQNVRDYVLGFEESRAFLDLTAAYLNFLIPLYEREGKSQVTIAIGCTGGRHRSVVVAEEVAARVAAPGRAVIAGHRDIGRADEEGSG